MTYNDDPTLLSWAQLDETGARHAPVVVCGDKGGERDVVLSRLASEVLGSGGRVLWIGRSRGTTPLAWMRVTRVDLPVDDSRRWPLPDPMSLEPAHLVAWLAHATGVRKRFVRRMLARAVGENYTAGLPYHAALASIRTALDSALAATGESGEGLTWEGGAHETAGAELAVWPFDAAMVAVSASTRDIAQLSIAIGLLVLSFASYCERSGDGAPSLIVFDNSWDRLGTGVRELLRGPVADFAALQDGRVVIATEDPSAWESDLTGLALMERSVPIVSADFSGRWPTAWGSAGPRLSPETAGSVSLPLAPWFVGEPITWRWLRCPSPIAEPVPGVSILDVDDGEVVE